MMKRLMLIWMAAGPLATGAGVLEVKAPGYSWQNAEYTVSHVFIDEVAGSAADIEVRFDTQVFIDGENGGKVEVFTNLNRRNLATADKNGDGEHDGILPVDGNTIEDTTDHTDPGSGHYFIPHAMSWNDGVGRWTATLPANKTGAYRLTARFKETGASPWTWYDLRDHCVVVTPEEAKEIRMYELNVLNVEASGTLETQRSTWEDLSDRPGALHATPGRSNDWSLSSIAELGVNWLWFQPYHPYGIDGRDTGGLTWIWNGGSPYEDGSYPYALGSPYAVKNFWEIEPRTSAQFNAADSLAVQRSKAMTSFVDFVADADAAGIQIMPDAAFNHAAFDVELGQEGVSLWGGASGTEEIRNQELRFFSRQDDYYQRAGTGPGEAIAPAPDRFDFGKWEDVRDIYFGRYAALWRDSSSTDKQKDEGDWFDSTTHGFNGTDGGSFDQVTRNVWRYFGAYVPYWVSKSRPAGEDRNSIPTDGDAAVRYAWDARGIDGLRCDFGQGLPPRCWEYIINRAKSTKWNFVFMSESLDGMEVTYRSGRHFDMLNENLLFAVKGAGTHDQLAAAYEERRTSYGQALVLLNTSSHDEQNYADPWDAVARFAANATMDGAPMVFYGQELGLKEFEGFDLMEVNPATIPPKYVPHFKSWNSMMPLWNDTNFWNDQLAVAYGDLNAARAASPALRSSERWFLPGTNNQVYGVVKYEQEGVPVAEQDVVLAFVNLDLQNNQGDHYTVPGELATRIGLDDMRLYNVKNIAAYERPPTVTGRKDAFLWATPKSGADLKATGFGVLLNKVPGAVGDWDTVPYEAQFLRLIDVTPIDPFVVTDWAIDGADVELTCQSEPGRWYHLETSIDLEGWSPVLENIRATASSLDLVHLGGALDPKRFYRVRATVEPL